MITDSFAAPLKEAASIITEVGLDPFLVRKDEEVLPGVTARRFMQVFGTEVVRSIHPDTWVISMARRNPVYYRGWLVIDDVRFENEAQWVRDNGGVIVKVERPDLEPIDEGDHQAENFKTICDHVIINDADISVLMQRGAAMCDYIIRENK